ncbi:hypothetical protein BTR23_23500 [Alkalihalophilus pseudofirmus]|nr:hypothetical protein BTR23_23500 [Alkalihalophilus pseudofirmus]
MEHIIGIDFGTTNTVAAIITPAGPKIILDHEANKMTPSVVIKLNNKLVVGYDAKMNVAAFNQGNGIKEIKREIGKAGTVMLAGERYKPFEIAALILKKIKRNVEINLGEHVKKAIITVPAEFSDAQRNEIIQAGQIAGFEVEKIINEPTAAIMTYVYRQNVQNGTVLCYDFGGGTFDLSLADIEDGKIKVRFVGGDRKLGGADIDKVVLSYIKRDFEQTMNCRLSTLGIYELELEVEKLKISLSKSQSASINNMFTTTTGKKVKFFKKVDRTTFEQWIEPIIDKTIHHIEKLLNENNLNPQKDVEHILLVGGSSQIPLVRSKLQYLFGKRMTIGEVYAETSVAIGAALEANNRLRRKVIPGVTVKQDVSPYSIGLKVGIDGDNNVFDPIIRKNFPYNQEYSEKYDTALDFQNTMLLEIYQGEHSVATKNEHICDFEIDDIPEREAGKESVRVSFMYDDNGIINIKAIILSTGKQIKKAIKHESKGNQRQTDQSKTKVDRHFTSDQQFKEALVLKKTLEQYSMSADSKKLEAALKQDDGKTISNMRSNLLD